MKVDLATAPTGTKPTACLLARWFSEVDDEQKPDVLGIIFRESVPGAEVGRWLTSQGVVSKDAGKLVTLHRRGGCVGCVVAA